MLLRPPFKMLLRRGKCGQTIPSEKISLPKYPPAFFKYLFLSPNTHLRKLLKHATIDSSGPFMGQFDHVVRSLVINLFLRT